MNALIKVSIPSLEMVEAELISVLEKSIYPGAEQASIKLVISYCRAAHLDPIQKPVHIVPMDVKVKKPGGGFDYTKRDVVMPGIGLYRTQAARTGEYAGISEPEFGPMKKVAFKRTVWEGSGQDRSSKQVDDEVEYPEWCRVIVKRIVAGTVCEFSAIEYWSENYASAGKDTIAPNTMWRKRPRGQIAKCAEAQALRKAFPEIGAQPTAEEMEGKSIDGDDIVDGVVTAKTVSQPQPRIEQQPGAAPTTETASPTGAPLSDGAKTTLRKQMERAGRTEADLVAAGFSKVDDIRFDRFNEVMDWLKKNHAKA